ncbi:glycosyltransferase family 1 protein, partial [Streptomyces sp. NPDC049577]
MRVVIVTESFPPDVNGVAHCAWQTAAHLVRRGHEPLAKRGAPRRGRLRPKRNRHSDEIRGSIVPMNSA